MRITVARLRDTAISLLALVLVSLLAGSRSWVMLAVTVLVNATWIVVLRRGSRRWEGAGETAAFVLNGLMLIWRFTESSIWLVVAAMWLLTVAADLSRLCRNFPAGSPPIYQRRRVRRHLGLLATTGAGSAAVVGLSRQLSLRPTLLALLLIAAFVVVGTVRLLSESGDESVSGTE